MIRTILTAAIVLGLAGNVFAQRQSCRACMPATLFNWWEAPQPLGELGEITTDRPDFTEASSTVGLGVSQIEAGYTYTEDGDNQSHSWGEPLLRVGLFANWFEFRIASFPVSNSARIRGQRVTDSGYEDLYLGAKIWLTPQDGILPEMAIIPQMTVPTGGSAFTNGQVHPGANLIYSWELTDDLSLAGSTQYNSASIGVDRYAEWAQSIAVGTSLWGDLGAYGEWYALFPSGAANVDPEHYLNGGFTYLISDDVQFDIRAGMGLNDEAADFFVGSGLSVRFR